jgi:hypothetical protein
MELNESLIITFLLIVIVVLIFSNISVSLGDSSDSNNQNQPSNTKAPVATERPKLYKVDNDLLSNDVKKQLNTLNNQFYFNDCRI